MVIKIEPYWRVESTWVTIEYLKCREDLTFEVDFRVNGVIGTIVTKWDLILFG